MNLFLDKNKCMFFVVKFCSYFQTHSEVKWAAPGKLPDEKEFKAKQEAERKAKHDADVKKKAEAEAKKKAKNR